MSPWIIIATSILALRAIGKRRGDIAHANDSAHRRKSLAGYNLGFLDAALAALTGGTIVVYLLFFVSEYATNRFGNCVLITSVPVLVGAVALSAAYHGAHGESRPIWCWVIAACWPPRLLRNGLRVTDLVSEASSLFRLMV